MTPEEQAAAEAEANAEAEFEASLEGLSDEEKQSKRAEREAHSKVDYEAELAKERKAREEAEAKLKETREKARERIEVKREQQPQGTPLTKEELEELLTRERQATEKRFEEQESIRMARELARSDAEAELTLELHKSTTFPPHFTMRDRIRAAHAMANREKIIGEREEALRALRGKEGVSRDATTGFFDSLPGSEPKLSSQDAQAIKDAGFIWNGTSRRFEKKLPNGNIVIRDSKTGNTQVVSR